MMDRILIYSNILRRRGVGCLSTPGKLRVFAGLAAGSSFFCVSTIRGLSTAATCSSAAAAASNAVLPNGAVLRQELFTLYQFGCCPFCCKVRATLDFLGLTYKVVEVDPIWKKELEFSQDYKKVPVLVVGEGEKAVRLVESHRIVNALCKKLYHPESYIENDERVAARIRWIDDELVQLIVMNIYRTPSEASKTLDCLLTHKDMTLAHKLLAKTAGAFFMWSIARSKKHKKNVEDVRKALIEAMDEFADSLRDKFHGGPKPDEADLQVFGVFCSIVGLPCEQDVLPLTRANKWYKTMQRVIEENRAKK